jgi:hypothetical protein
LMCCGDRFNKSNSLSVQQEQFTASLSQISSQLVLAPSSLPHLRFHFHFGDQIVLLIFRVCPWESR